MTEQRKSHLDRVSATLSIVGYEMRPEELTEILGIKPSMTEVTHLPASFHTTGRHGGRDCGLWCYDTAGVVSGVDAAEHLRHLLRLFRPLKSRMDEIHPPLRLFVHLRCCCMGAIQNPPALSPRIEADCIAGIAELGAGLTVELLPAKG